MKINKLYIFFAGLVMAIFAAGYFTTLAATKPAFSEKQLEGIWKPVKFLNYDYAQNKLVELPLNDEKLYGGGEKYLHFRGNTVCTDGVLQGPHKKLCSDSSDPKFHEFFGAPLTRGGTQINVWADNEKTYTIPLEVEIKDGKLIETYGSGSQKFYEKVKNSGISPKKQKKKAPSGISKLQGVWHVVGVYDGPSQNGPFTPNANLNSENALKLTFKADGYCRSDYTDPMDETKPYCEPIIFNPDGTFTGGRLQAFGGFMRMNGAQLEFIEGGKGYTKYVLKK